MAAHQAPLSLGFSRQEHWSGLPVRSPMQESEKWKWSCSVVSDSLWPHGLQPTRLLHAWDFPGRSTGVGFSHCLLPIFGYKEYNQSDFGVDHLEMSMCRVFQLLCCWKRVFAMTKHSRVGAKSVSLCPLLAFILYSKAKLACYSRYYLTSYFCIPVPYDEKNIFFCVSSRRSCRSSQNCSASAFSALAVWA